MWSSEGCIIAHFLDVLAFISVGGIYPGKCLPDI
jgi:hypothetical protein